YLRTQVLDQEAFADRAVAALEDDGVRKVVGREIVVNLIDRGSTDLVAARPLLESVVGAVIQTEPFQQIFRRAAVEANRVFFEREKSNALFDIADSAQLVRFALKSVSPELAAQLPKDIEGNLLALRRREFAGKTLAVADDVRLLGVVLPLLGLLVLVAAIAIAPDRRIAVLRSGLAFGTSAALFAAALLILRARILAGVIGEDELTDADVRGAVAGLLDAFLGDLISGAFLLALLGLVVGAAAAALDPEHVDQPVTRLRRRIAGPTRTNWGRALRGVGALVLGVLVVLSPLLALQLAAIAAGAFLIFYGTSELLVLLQPAGRDAPGSKRSRRRAFTVAAAAAGVCAAVLIALVLVFTSGEEEGALATSASTRSGACNGSVALCELRLNEAVFAGTHNSFSAADSPGWYIANQRRTIKRQLRDGIRLFLIDPHWGVEDAEGKVRTDFAAEGRSRNRVAKKLPPNVLKAAERLVGRLGAGEGDGTRELWLCHTVCEIGATPMVDSLTEIREFLEANRGEVVILFIEPYVPPAEIAKVFRSAGLDRYLAELERDEPLPTLGALVRRNKRVVVLSEKDADGTLPWYLDGFSFVQDTPLGATETKQLSCKLERGDADSPFLMLNHWADFFPPRLPANRPFQTRRFVLARAHRCARERGLPVSLIAVDHYDQGEFLPAVAELNAERVQALRQRQRVGG
ncbi:MAG TPA: hypothetical protein VES62_12815, partial [Thermoleophilaceae bacterium]|nr:hypothetical protein [Thermoleophilaceae bacterium]